MSWTHFACIGRLSATCCGAGIILERRFESVPGREANLDVLDPAVLAVNVAVLVVAVADCKTTHRLQRIEIEHQVIVDAPWPLLPSTQAVASLPSRSCQAHKHCRGLAAAPSSRKRSCCLSGVVAVPLPAHELGFCFGHHRRRGRTYGGRSFVEASKKKVPSIGELATHGCCEPPVAPFT